VANLDGMVGVAIGRTEPKQSNTRKELIVDPATGQLIGMRARYTTSERPKALPDDPEQLYLTAMSTTVVDSAP
jgi:hypothetical protein